MFAKDFPSFAFFVIKEKIMENIIYVSIIAVVVVVVLFKIMNFTGEYDDAKVSVEHEGKKGGKTVVSLDLKRKQIESKE